MIGMWPRDVLTVFAKGTNMIIQSRENRVIFFILSALGHSIQQLHTVSHKRNKIWEKLDKYL